MSAKQHTGEPPALSAPEAAARRERYLACLADLSTRLLQSRDPLAALEHAIHSLREASGADRCYAFEIKRSDAGAHSVLRAESHAPGVPPLRATPGRAEIRVD